MFKDILLNLLEEKGLNQRQFSQLTGIPTTTISGWINANRLPDYNALIKMRLFFDIPADELLGITDECGTTKKAVIYNHSTHNGDNNF